MARNYIVTVQVNKVNGCLTFRVSADSEDEAIKKWQRNGGKLVEKDIEVEGLDSEGAEAELEE